MAGPIIRLALRTSKHGQRATYTVQEGQDEHEEWAERGVTAYERVTVPAGTFMAFRVSITAASYDDFDETYWYAPDIGYVAKLVAGDFVVELDDWMSGSGGRNRQSKCWRPWRRVQQPPHWRDPACKNALASTETRQGVSFPPVIK